MVYRYCAFSLSLLLISVIITGCAGARKEWEIVKAEDTVDMYEYFLREHPQGKLAEEARMCLAWKKTKLQHTITAYVVFMGLYPHGKLAEEARATLLRLLKSRDTLRKAKIVKIVVDQGYSYRSSSDLHIIEDFSLPFEDVARQLLNSFGIDVTNDINKADAILEIESSGQALEHTYTDEIGLYKREHLVYGGARLFGTIVLTTPDRSSSIKRAFEGEKVRYKIRLDLSIGRERLRSAPFGDLFQQTFVPEVTQIIKGIFDPIEDL